MRAAIALVVAACGGAQSPQPTAVPSVSVIEAGAEPREVIRYAPAVGTRERVELDLKIQQTVSMTNTVLETEKRSADFPTLRLTIDQEVTERNARGDVSIAATIADVTVLEDMIDPQVRNQLVSQSAGLKGVRSRFRVESSGRVFARENPDAPAVPALRGSLQDLPAVFPETPLGVGATWTVTTVERIRNVTWQQTAKYRLAALTEHAATVDATITMKADSQELRVEPNATTRLTSGHVSGTGQFVVPRRGLITTGSLQSATETSFQTVRRHLRLASTMRTETLVVSRRSTTPAASQ